MDISPKRRKKLEKGGWAVYCTNTLTRRAIFELLQAHGMETEEKNIYHYGNPVLVIFINLDIAIRLADNKDRQGHEFTIYHEETKGDGFWTKWNEERKNEKQKLAEAKKKGILPKASTERA